MTHKITLQALAATLALAAGSSAWAVEYGTVVSVTPVQSQVPVFQRLCNDEPVAVQSPSAGNGAGAVLGAIVGGVIGYQMGGGVGQAVATGLGMVAGAAVGDQVQANNNPPVQGTAQRCRSVTQYDSRIVGYDVVYDYQGVRRSTRLAQDPGNRIPLDVNVAPAGSAAPVRSSGGTTYLAPSANGVVSAPVVGDQTVVYYNTTPEVVVAAPRYVAAPTYYAAPGYYGPVVSINPWPTYVVRSGGWYGGRHRH